MLELTSYVKVIKKSKPWGINIEGGGGGGLIIISRNASSSPLFFCNS